MDWGDWIAVVAIVVSGVGIWRTDARAKKAEQDAAAADKKAAQAVAAAERSANNLERIAEAMERQSIQVERQSVTPGVVWTLEHHEGDTVLLTNVGRATAYDVQVEANESVFLQHLPTGTVLAPGDAEKFFAGRSLATADDTVRVSWSAAPGGERSTWRRPLPPDPRRGGWVTSV